MNLHEKLSSLKIVDFALGANAQEQLGLSKINKSINSISKLTASSKFSKRISTIQRKCKNYVVLNNEGETKKNLKTDFNVKEFDLLEKWTKENKAINILSKLKSNLLSELSSFSFNNNLPQISTLSEIEDPCCLKLMDSFSTEWLEHQNFRLNDNLKCRVDEDFLGYWDQENVTKLCTYSCGQYVESIPTTYDLIQEILDLLSRLKSYILGFLQTKTVLENLYAKVFKNIYKPIDKTKFKLLDLLRSLHDDKLSRNKIHLFNSLKIYHEYNKYKCTLSRSIITS